jgi:hypothetical protein
MSSADPLTNNLPARLKARREVQLNLSQREAAAQIGVSVQDAAELGGRDVVSVAEAPQGAGRVPERKPGRMTFTICFDFPELDDPLFSGWCWDGTLGYAPQLATAAIFDTEEIAQRTLENSYGPSDS